MKSFKNLFRRAALPARRDFIDMGLGIDARAKRCYKFWRPHLELTKAFQRRAVEVLDGKGSLAILGAGSLLDIDIIELQKQFNFIELYDANPSALDHWKRFIVNRSDLYINGIITDLSNSIDIWSKSLDKFLSENKIPSQAELSKFFSKLKVGPPTKFSKNFDVIFSINLLSQIPIYWRDRVQKKLYRKLKIDTDEFGLYPLELQRALENSMANLQHHHLKSLSLSSAKIVVVISDVEFLYYKRDISEWQKEGALYFSEEIKIEEYQEELHDTWLWHIIPQGIEEQEYGSYHKVMAHAFTKLPAN